MSGDKCVVNKSSQGHFIYIKRSDVPESQNGSKMTAGNVSTE